MTLSRPIVLRAAVATLAVAAVVLLTVHAPDAFAQATDPTQARFTGVLDAFKAQSISWQTTLTGSAQWLFMTLAIMSFLWANGALILKGGDMGEFVSTNFREIARIGFMYVLLVHAFDWSTAFVQGFRHAGEAATGQTGMDPAAVFQSGLQVAGLLFTQVSLITGLAESIGLIFCSIVMVFTFALLAGFMAVTIVESYIVIGGSVLLLGFGGAGLSSDIAKRTIMYCISVGAKLFVMQLIVGVGIGTVLLWARTYAADGSTGTLSLLGLVVLFVILAKQIPETVQGMLSGSSFAGTGTMLSTVAAAAMAGAATTAAIKAAVPAVAAAASGGAGAAGAAGGGAGTAASSLAGASASPRAMMAESGMHMARAGGATMAMATGMDIGGAISSLAVGQRPDPPSMELGGGSGASSGGGSDAGDGGTITGAGGGSGAASPGQPSAPGEVVPGSSGSSGSSLGAGFTASAGRGGASAGNGSAAAAPSPSGASPNGTRSGASSSGDSAVQGGGGTSASNRSVADSDLGGSSDPSTAQPSEPQGLDARASSRSAPSDSPSAAADDLGGGQGSVSSDDVSAVASGRGAASAPGSVDRTASEPLDQSPAAPSVTAADAGQADQNTGMDAGYRRTQAVRGAVVGAIVAGPIGAVVGAAAGAAAAPGLDAIGKRAATALAAAKTRFGLNNA